MVSGKNREKFHSDRKKQVVRGSIGVVCVVAIFSSDPACKTVEKHLTFRNLLPGNDNDIMQFNFGRPAWCCLVSIFTLMVQA